MKFCLRVSLLLIALVALLGCATDPVQSKAPRQQQPVVVTATVVEKAVPVEVRVVGNVEAYASIRVKAQVNGQLTKVYFQEGREVKSGELLFLIDPRPYDEAIRQAEANHARNTALLRQAEANLKRDIAQEKYARDQAARYQKLMAEGIMSKQQAEQFASDADARAEAVSADRAAIESAQAAIKADAALLESARLQRNYCEIRSPIDGRTGDLLINEGNLVRTSDAELVTIHQIHPVYVTFSIPETRLPDVKRYMAAGRLTVLASPSDRFTEAEKGILTFVDNAVDSTTGTIKLKGTFDNAASTLWPGLFVNVMLRLTTLEHAVVVPARAVQTGQEGEFTYVVGKDMTAEMRKVVTAMQVGDEFVVREGLSAGETVVTEGQLRIAPGMRVRTGGRRGS
jgi:multidrug efflux system membrane fusion protein